MKTQSQIEAAVKAVEADRNICLQALDFNGVVLMSGVLDALKWVVDQPGEFVERLDKCIAAGIAKTTEHERN